MLPSEIGPTARVPHFALRAAALLGLVALLLFGGNGATSAFDRDEARFALAVREMRERGDWVLPTNYGEPRYHKPILAYWLALGAERVLGPGEFARRFPSSAEGVLTVLATLLLARRRFGERVALRAATVLGTSLVLLIETKILTADAALLATTTLSFWAWNELRESATARRGWQLLFWVALALGILAKGVNVFFLLAAGVALVFLRSVRLRQLPARAAALGLLGASIAAALPGIGFLGPLGLAGLALWIVLRARGERGNFGERRGPRVALGAAFGLPLCLALVALWLVPALVRTGGAFLSEGVGHHMLERTASPFEGHRGIPGYYLLTSLLALFPWGGWMPATLRAAWRDPSSEFFLAWILGPWALLECMASKLPHYVLVTLPAVAILIALHWDAHGSPRVRRIQSALFLLPCALLASAGIALALRLGGDVPPWGVLLSVVAAGGGLGHLVRARSGRPASFGWTAGTAAALYLVLTQGLLPSYEPLRIAAPLGRELARLARPDESLCLVRYRPASVGCIVPAGHPVVQDTAALDEVLAQGQPTLFVVLADGKDARFAAGTGEPRPEWNLVGTVEGLDGLRARRLWLLRRRE